MKIAGKHQCRQSPAVAKRSAKKSESVLLRFVPESKKKKPGLGERTDQEVRKERLQRRKLGEKGVY